MVLLPSDQEEPSTQVRALMRIINILHNFISMRVLGIETSCDETAVSVVETRDENFLVREVTNVVHSQVDLHAEFGGVVPNLAKREHQKLLMPVLVKALNRVPVAKIQPTIEFSPVEQFFDRNQPLFESVQLHFKTLKKPDIDLIAVTNGPGLEPALWVGVTLARALAVLWGVPLVGVDHMRGHICANFIGQSSSQFPALGLTISGGHTQLVLMEQALRYKLLGETVDDAAGEAFDKVARLLDMPYPGGVPISNAAEQGDAKAFNLPRPMMHSGDENFSFSGLKTAVLYLTQQLGQQQTQLKKNDIAASFQQAVVDVVVKKTLNACEKHAVHSVLVGGGVIANKQLRAQLTHAIQNNTNATLHIPPLSLCTDNAAMIACAGALEHIHLKKQHNPQTIEVDSNKVIDED